MANDKLQVVREIIFIISLFIVDKTNRISYNCTMISYGG